MTKYKKISKVTEPNDMLDKVGAIQEKNVSEVRGIANFSKTILTENLQQYWMLF